MRIKSVASGLLTLTLVGAGLALVAVFLVSFLGGDGDTATRNTATNGVDPGGFNVPEPNASRQATAGGPEDKTLSVTIPDMSRVENADAPYAAGDNERALKQNAAIHLKGTGFPWQEESNTYLAGHRLGYPGTDSFLAFYDLNKLENGDEIYVEDAEGTEYTYRVYKSFVVNPSDVRVTEPVEGKNVLTLQTCTLPDYSQLIITRAELVETEEA